MNNKSSSFYENKSSGSMATASLVLGILAVVTCCCIYTALIFGSLAVILALLSRGGEQKMTSISIAGLILGIVGISLGVFFIIFITFSAFLSNMGMENYYDSFYTMPDEYNFYRNQYDNFL